MIFACLVATAMEAMRRNVEEQFDKMKEQLDAIHSKQHIAIRANSLIQDTEALKRGSSISYVFFSFSEQENSFVISETFNPGVETRLAHMHSRSIPSLRFLQDGVYDIIITCQYFHTKTAHWGLGCGLFLDETIKIDFEFARCPFFTKRIGLCVNKGQRLIVQYQVESNCILDTDKILPLPFLQVEIKKSG